MKKQYTSSDLASNSSFSEMNLQYRLSRISIPSSLHSSDPNSVTIHSPSYSHQANLIHFQNRSGFLSSIGLKNSPYYYTTVRHQSLDDPRMQRKTSQADLLQSNQIGLIKKECDMNESFDQCKTSSISLKCFNHSHITKFENLPVTLKNNYDNDINDDINDHMGLDQHHSNVRNRLRTATTSNSTNNSKCNSFLNLVTRLKRKGESKKTIMIAMKRA